jgi:hypothetical protein
VTLKAAQDVERTRHHLNDIAFAGSFMHKRSLLAQPLRAPPHAILLYSALRN